MRKITEIDSVLLDMDGTLLDLHFDQHFWMEHLPVRYAELTEKSLTQAREEIMSVHSDYRGTLNWYSLEFWQNRLSVDILALKQEVSDKIKFRPNAKQFLDWLNESGYRVLLATNAHPWSVQLKFDCLDLAGSFHGVCSSHTYGAPKEEQKFWDLLCQDMEIDRTRAKFVDDNKEVLDSAREFGISQLYAIAQPDLAREPVESFGYVQIDDFSEFWSPA